ncbi:MAG: GYF domain-containing protein [Hyphomicrobiaceae bacterium]
MTVQDASQWYIARDGKQTGPISDAEINAIAQHGYFRTSDLVWKPGFAEWRPALSVFMPAAPEAAPPKPAAAAPAPPPSQPAQQQQPAQQSAPASRPIGPSPAAAVPAPREPAVNRDAPARSSVQGQPGSYDGAAFDHRPSQPVAREPAAQTFGAAPQAPAPAPAPAPARQPASQPAPNQLGPAPFSARAPQQESKLPVAPPYRTEPTQRPVTAQPAAQSGNGERLGAQREQTQRPAPRETTQPNRRVAMTPVDTRPEAEPGQPPRSHKGAIAALSIVGLAVVGGVWVAANPGAIQGLPDLKAVTANLTTRANKTASLEARWQQTAHWPVIKREFPDWYGERLREAAQLASENKPEDEINKVLVDQLISLRRQNASAALAASTPKLRALASAFLENLRQLKAQSTTVCFNFISQGEGTPGVIDQFQNANGVKSPMQLQVAAIFDAIGEGRKSPITHEKPIKTDYDALMEQLSKLGWSQTDVATFADPNALARAEPARVCQMVQDWFVAHISITDEGTQERLLGETLRPVVSG